jgi:hypothetical protein
MKRNEYKILKREIPDVNLHSLTGQYWFEYSNQWLSWVTGSLRIPGMTPETGSLVHDIRWYSGITYNLDDTLFYSGKTYISLKDSNLNHIPSDVSSSYWNEIEQRAINNTQGKYYKWNGNSWVLYTGPLGYDYVIPIALEADADEMGVFSSFDGFIEQVEQIVNFSYKQSESTITVYGTMNPDKLRKIVDQSFTINWGDGTTGSLGVNSGVLYSNFPSTTHTYTTSGQHLITITLDSPWSKQKTQKIVTTPQNITVSNPMGTFTGFTIPSDGSNLNYLNDYEYATGYTATPSKPFKFMAIGQSKIGDFKRYGETVPRGVDSGSLTDGTKYTGYTVNGLYYMDREDGFTQITGSVSNYRFGPTSGYTYEISGDTINTIPYLTTSGNTTEFETEYDVINYITQHRLTRNEHFIGFIDDPTVYSDVFVERGRQGVMEVNLRLGEIDNMSELDIYGNGYFKVRKQ